MTPLFRSRTMACPKSKQPENTSPKKALSITTRTLKNDGLRNPATTGRQLRVEGKAMVGTAVRQVFKSIGNVVQGQREPEISNPTISPETLDACKSKFKLIPIQNAAENENIAKREEDFERRGRKSTERRMKARTKRTEPIIGLPFGRRGD